MDGKPVLAIHGGAGTISKERMTPDKRDAYLLGLQTSLDAGNKILEAGGLAVDAVQEAVQKLEDCPLFNAGKGSVFSHAGIHEMDASIMDGRGREAGSVASVVGIKNPISLARKVMTDSVHVLLSGRGAEEFAALHQIAMEYPNYFRTDERFAQWEHALKTDTVFLDHTGEDASEQDHLGDGKKFGTVGAVALDGHGNLAAATSTGGMTNKKFGRIGDSPLIGSGTWADNESCAVSCTGDGEFFMRSVAAYDVHALMSYARLALAGACRKVIHEHVKTLGGEGGIIAIDREGNVCLPFNSAGMYRGVIRDGKSVVGIFGGETPGIE
jgi:beta-aspartyl-peptidase (threonine type)